VDCKLASSGARQNCTKTCISPRILALTDAQLTEDQRDALEAHFSVRQRMDIVFTAGQYLQTGMMMNPFGVQLDEGHQLDPDLAVHRAAVWP
jgi:hypothetical protein